MWNGLSSVKLTLKLNSGFVTRMQFVARQKSLSLKQPTLKRAMSKNFKKNYQIIAKVGLTD